MLKIFILLTISLISNITIAQNCPTRIGDFVLNETTIPSLYKWSIFREVYSGTEFLDYEVDWRERNEEYSGIESMIELFPDIAKPSGWYSTNYASFNDSVRVFFIPNYKTDGLFIKNVVLKFYNDTLFFIRASISKSYQDVLLEKYKKKFFQSENKKIKSECKNKILKGNLSLNTFMRFVFYKNTDTTTFGWMILEHGLTKNCDVYDEDRIEIFNKEKYSKMFSGNIIGLKRRLEEQKLDKQNKKEVILNRF
jgi:hypothetical protein